MLNAEHTTQFKRDLKLAKRRGKDLNLIRDIMTQIQNCEPLNAKLRNHSLAGNWNSHTELHVEPDWLLIYKLIPENKKVIFVRTGSHSDLFR